MHQSQYRLQLIIADHSRTWQDMDERFTVVLQSTGLLDLSNLVAPYLVWCVWIVFLQHVSASWGAVRPHIFGCLEIGLLSHSSWSQLLRRNLAPWNLCSHRRPWWHRLSLRSCGLRGRCFSSPVFFLICLLLGSIDQNGLRGLECTTSLFMGIASCMQKRIRRYVYSGI